VPVVAVIGAQWGDEGKGHIVDYLANQAKVVIRYGGGSNAGHTVVNEKGTFKLHLIPSGIFDTQIENIIAHGVVIDPEVLIQEIKTLNEHGIDTSRLFVSNRAHIVMPYHAIQEKFQEQARGDGKIGTTGRGIGPAYADKMERIGLRMGDLLHEATLLERLRAVLEEKNRLLSRLYGVKPFKIYDEYLRYLECGRQLIDHITDVHPRIQRALENDVPVLLEGAQGVMLDIDHGTYPYVTSSPPGAAGACQGAGVGPSRISSVVGTFKAYTTRVGAGPFPTEIDDEDAEVLRQTGKPWAEVGTTTGRSRRVGWFDAVMARYASEINGIDTIAITKLDVLDTLTRIKVCVGYRRYDETIEYPPVSAAQFREIEPVYEELPGWQQPTGHVRKFEDLPEEAQSYVARLCQLVGARIGLVSVGPERDQIITVNKIF
jgi:adenylosuccinate synthase